MTSIIAGCAVRLRAGKRLDRADIRMCVHAIARGNVSDDEIVNFLRAFNGAGFGANELAGFVMATMPSSQKIMLGSPILDLAGTGGSGLERFNTSTSAAFVVAACGVPVAKHCGSGTRGLAGSIEFLAALDCPAVAPEHAQDFLNECGLVFICAHRNPVFSNATRARRMLDERTIYNFVGPLSNPVHISHQMIGIPDAAYSEMIARTALELGSTRVLVVTGETGIDEVSVSGQTKFLLGVSKSLGFKRFMFKPADFGIKAVPYESMPKGNAAENADLFREVLVRKRQTPLQNLIAVNAGAALFAAGVVPTIPDGFRRAREALISGAVEKKFREYKQHVQSAG